MRSIKVSKYQSIISAAAIGICILVTGLAGLSFAQAPEEEVISIETFYPSPWAEYNELHLYPHSEETQCDSAEREGLMYYDNGTHSVKVCKPDSSSASGYNWKDVNYWQLSGNDISNTNGGVVEVMGHFKVATSVTPIDGDVLTYDSATGEAVWKQPSGGSSFSNVKQFVSSQNWTIPSGVTQIMVEVWSAGGGGGGGKIKSCCQDCLGFSGSGSGGGSSSFGTLISAGGGCGGSDNGSSGCAGTSSASINVSGQAGNGSTGGMGGLSAGRGGDGGCGDGGCGGGGGGGAYGKSIFSVIASTVYSVTVGSGGIGGLAQAVNASRLQVVVAGTTVESLFTGDGN